MTAAVSAAVLLPLCTTVAFLIAPGALDDKLHAAMRGICAQRPAHSLIVDGRPLALEARMLGIYGGFALAVATAWAGGASRRCELPRGRIGVLLAGGILAMVADGLNAWTFDLGGPALYTPETVLRLTTGLLAGVGAASYVAPVLAYAFWRERDPRPLFATWAEYGRVLLVVATAGLAAWLGIGGATLWSVLAALSVVATYWLVNTYLAVGAWVGVARADRWTELGTLATVGFALTVVELAALAVLRSWLEGVYGVSWPV